MEVWGARQPYQPVGLTSLASLGPLLCSVGYLDLIGHGSSPHTPFAPPVTTDRGGTQEGG